MNKKAEINKMENKDTMESIKLKTRSLQKLIK